MLRVWLKLAKIKIIRRNRRCRRKDSRRTRTQRRVSRDSSSQEEEQMLLDLRAQALSKLPIHQMFPRRKPRRIRKAVKTRQRQLDNVPARSQKKDSDRPRQRKSHKRKRNQTVASKCHPHHRPPRWTQVRTSTWPVRARRVRHNYLRCRRTKLSSRKLEELLKLTSMRTYRK